LLAIPMSGLGRPQSSREPCSGAASHRWLLRGSGGLRGGTFHRMDNHRLNGAELIYRRQPERRAPRGKYQDLVLLQDASLGLALHRRTHMRPLENYG
jgi:hypothetical protein